MLSLWKEIIMYSSHLRTQTVNPSWANQIPSSGNLELRFRGVILLGLLELHAKGGWPSPALVLEKQGQLV